jgi:cytochrome c oxidase assembly factor CtaG
MSQPLAPLDFFVKARFEPVAAAVLIVAAGWYLWSVRRVRAQGHTWPPGRTVCFVYAWLLVVASVFSGLTDFGADNFSAFGSQYIIVGLVAPVLLACSAPVALAVQSSRRPDRARWLESRPARFLAHPFVTWILFCGSMLAVFFSGIVDAAIRGGAAQQAVFLWWLFVGWLFFWPVVDVDPIPRRIGFWPRILYLLLAFPVFAVLGMGLESQSARIAPGISVGSLHLGAAVIWVAGETVALGGVLSIFRQWLRDDERRIKAHERVNEEAAARQMALWRASRAAAARAASQ